MSKNTKIETGKQKIKGTKNEKTKLKVFNASNMPIKSVNKQKKINTKTNSSNKNENTKKLTSENINTNSLLKEVESAQSSKLNESQTQNLSTEISEALSTSISSQHEDEKSYTLNKETALDKIGSPIKGTLKIDQIILEDDNIEEENDKEILESTNLPTITLISKVVKLMLDKQSKKTFDKVSGKDLGDIKFEEMEDTDERFGVNNEGYQKTYSLRIKHKEDIKGLKENLKQKEDRITQLEKKNTKQEIIIESQAKDIEENKTNIIQIEEEYKNLIKEHTELMKIIELAEKDYNKLDKKNNKFQDEIKKLNAKNEQLTKDNDICKG